MACRTCFPISPRGAHDEQYNWAQAQQKAPEQTEQPMPPAEAILNRPNKAMTRQKQS